MLLWSRWGRTAQSLVDHRVSAFAEELNFTRRRPDDDRHPLPLAAEFQNVKELIAVLRPFGRNLITTNNRYRSTT